MSDDWGDSDWPQTVSTVPPTNGDDWGSTNNAVNNTNTNQRFYGLESPKGMHQNKRKFDDNSEHRNDWSGFGRGLGRAKRRENNWDRTQQNKQQFDDSNQSSDTFSRNNRNDFGSDSKRVIQISSTFVGRVIGKGGQNIRDLQSKSGARIHVNRDSSNSYETDIELSGTPEQMDSANKLINDLVDNNSSHYNTNNSYNKTKTETPSVSVSNEPEYIDWGAAIKESEEATKQKWAALPPINKQFYFEHQEIRGMNPDLVDQFREENNNIMVSHFNEGDERPIPNPIQKFSEAFEHFPEILEEIEKQGFEKPSPVQCQSWPILLSGIDMIGIAQTGTGKTLAYLLPALIHIDNQQLKRSERPGPTALIMAPTRELAQQIEKECQKYHYRDIKCICIYGGGDRKLQISKVGKGVEIVIATPGRLNDLCMNKYIDLTSVSYLVLDEADEMLDKGFEPEIKKIMLDVRPDRQTVMMSATWPQGVRRLAVAYMKDPMQVFVGTLDLSAAKGATQKIIMTSNEEKRKILYDFVKNMKKDEKVIIFVGRKAVADDLASDLILKGINCQSMHGDRDQTDREQALDDIKTGYVQILIATDVASRGLDIYDITHIFNYDFPREIEKYVHRVGRTARAGRTGTSITLMTREDWKNAKELINILEKNNQEVPSELVSMSERYAVWKEKHDAEIAACGGRGGRGGRRGGGFGGGGKRW